MDERQRVEFGRRVRDARVARGLNQVQLAEVAGVAPNTVGSIELGRRSAQPQSVAAVMAALGMEPAHEAVVKNDLPKDVELVSQVVTMWLMGVPEGERRAAAVLDLVRFLAAPRDGVVP